MESYYRFMNLADEFFNEYFWIWGGAIILVVVIALIAAFLDKH